MKAWSKIVSLGVAFSLSGCSAISGIPNHYYDLDRQNEYPLAIVPAQFPPEVVIDFDVTGKGGGAAQGAGRGMLECMRAGQGGGDFAALAVLLCMPFGATIGAIHGATTAESADKVEEINRQFRAELTSVRRQETIAHEAADYLGKLGIQADVMDASSGPRSADDLPHYAPGQFKGYGGVLELRVLELHVKSSGKKGADLCLSMNLVARKIDGHAGEERDELEHRVSRGCRSTESWMHDGGKPLFEEIRAGYTLAARQIVDEFYLIYYPRVDVDRAKVHSGTGETEPQPKADEFIPSAPTFVLRPIQPALTTQPEANIFASAPKNRIGYGGLQFADVKTLSPRFKWEPFPRDFDLQDTQTKNTRITDVVYDFQIYEGFSGPLKAVLPLRPIYTRSGLQESQHQIEEELSYCSWYFWTVRARFRLNDVPRVTEWAGAYESAGGFMSPGAYRRNRKSIVWMWPPDYLYYPFRTPADPDWPACWDDRKVYRERQISRSQSKDINGSADTVENDAPTAQPNGQL
jgi:hypothetical protein